MGLRHLRTTITIGSALAAAIALVVAASPAEAAKPGGSSGGTCVQSAPEVHIVNTSAWATPGSWGVAGEQLSYAMDVFNRDSGCGTSSFTVSLSAPDGFAVSGPVSVSVASRSDAYAHGTVTSPGSAADGNYTVTAAVARSGSAPAGSAQSVYIVYSSDTTAPKEYWLNPADGSAISGRSANVGFAASDDHQIAQVSIAVDGVTVATTACSNVAYECQLSYNWSIRRVSGAHTATFTARDYVGNTAATSTTFSVN
jgi:hypothetical protein